MYSIDDDDDCQPILLKRPSDPGPLHYNTTEVLKPVPLRFGLPLAAWVTILATVMAGFLFGYDIGIMSGAIVVLSRDTRDDVEHWGVAQSEYRKELIVSMTIIFAAIGSLASGPLNEAAGRRYTLITATLIFLTSSVLMAVAANWVVLTIGRAVAGVAIGLMSTTAPPHISEQMPTEWRGPMNVLNQLMITVGILVACVVAGCCSYVHHGWRWMVGLGAAPAVVMFLLVCHIPESIRWLAHHGRQEEAKEVLVKLRGSADVEVEWGYILEDVSSVEERRSGVYQLRKMLLCVPVRRALILGIMLQVFQQITGINSVIYYAATIILKAGSFKASQAIWLGVIVAAVNTTATAAGLLSNAIERCGRKGLLICSLAGMSLGLGILARSFYLQEEQGADVAWLAVLGLCTYTAGFAPGMGPLPWAVNSELYPMWCRDTAVSITTTTNWIFNTVVSMTFLTMSQNIGTYLAFCLYLFACLVAIVYFMLFMPETRGVPLEKVQDIFRDRLVFSPCSQQ